MAREDGDFIFIIFRDHILPRAEDLVSKLSRVQFFDGGEIARIHTFR